MPRSGSAAGVSVVSLIDGFNEAGAIMPRSGAGSVKDAAPEPIRFNEAGAIMPRSGQDRRWIVGGSDQASMRPGQSCPGVGECERNGCAYGKWLQ